MGLKKLIDLDRLSRFKNGIANLLSTKQDKPIRIVIQGTGSSSDQYTVIGDTSAIGANLLNMLLNKANAELEVRYYSNDPSVVDIKERLSNYTAIDAGGTTVILFWQSIATPNSSMEIDTIFEDVYAIWGNGAAYYAAHRSVQFAKSSDIPASTSQLQNDSQFISATDDVVFEALIPSGTTLATTKNFMSIYATFGSQQKVFFVAPVTSQYDVRVFEVSHVDMANSTIDLCASEGSTVYTVHLVSSGNTMSGELVSTTIPTLTAYRTAADQDIIDAAQNTAIAGKLPTTGNAYRTASIPMGHLDSTSTATVMTATVPGITELRDGVCVWLTNGVITSASGFTLNINSLGGKPCYSSLAAASRSTTIFNVNYTMLFVYNSTRVDGGCWDVVYGYDSNTNTIGYQLRTNGTTLPMSSVTYRYRLLFTSADGTHFVPANNSTSTNATSSRTVCQTPIDPHGMIFYYGTTASVAANANPSGSYLWTRYTVTLGYSFNRTGAALALSVNKPVYVKAAPQANGSAIIDADTPYVQDLPATNDGKIYIFLGVTTSATVVELVDVHPIYCNRNGRIQIWTGVEAEIDALKAQIAALDILDEEEF